MKCVVVVLCALGVLSGCGGSGEEQPKALPPVMAAGSAAPPGSGPTPTGPRTGPPATPGGPTASVLTPSTSPSSMSRADEAVQATNAEEFARKWVEATDRAYDTTDAQELVALSDPSCVSCQNYIRSVRHGAATGERYRGGKTVVRSAVAPPLENGETIVSVDVSASETQVLNPDGVVTRTVPPLKQGILNVTVRRLGGGWAVMEITRS